MPRFDASSAECQVFTFKEGLLSPIAHDLRIAVTRFEIEVAEDRSSVRATFDATSLRVETARKDGRDNPGALGAGDKRKIEGNIADDVLEVRRHREAKFESTQVRPRGEDEATIDGKLTLHGVTRPLSIVARKTDGKWVAEVRLHQPDYGIKPYRAAMGTLRIQDDVTVRVALPA